MNQIIRTTLSSIEIRNLMLETLAYEGDNIDSEGKTFKMYGYQGTQSDLIRLLEGLAVKKSLIPLTVQISESAWGIHGHTLHEGHTTNFNNTEIKRIYEQFHVLLNHEIISPGATGSYGTMLPYFHVTEYGLECLKELDILPYDIDGYLSKIRNIPNITDWTEFYIKEALSCFNANCMEAAIIMLGLANERIIQEQNDALLAYFSKHNSGEYKNMISELQPKTKASEKYNVYIKYFEKVKQTITKQEFIQIKPMMDKIAISSFLNFTRITRNDLAHPSDTRMERTEVLLIFISFCKFCEIQYKFINFFSSN